MEEIQENKDIPGPCLLRLEKYRHSGVIEARQKRKIGDMFNVLVYGRGEI